MITKELFTFKITIFDGFSNREYTVRKYNYRHATEGLRDLPPAYIWSCEPL